MEPKISLDKATIQAFCERHHIRKLALFGSVLTDRFSPESDVDVLVDFDEAHMPGLIAVSGMEEELSALIGRKTDLRTPGDLSRYFREEVVRTAVVQYAA